MSNTNEIKSVKDASLADTKRTACVDGKDLNQVLKDVSLDTIMGKGSIILTVEEDVPVAINEDWMKEVAVSLLDAAYSYDNKVSEELTPELLVKYMKWVVLNRLNYVKNGRNVCHPKDVKYPVVMFDALARICDYEGTRRDGAVLKPVIKSTEMTEGERSLFSKLNAKKVESLKEKDANQGASYSTTDWLSNGRIVDFPDRLKVTRMMEQAGIQLATGLPMEKRSADRTFYEIAVDTNNAVSTAGATPSIAQVFSRCFYELEAVTKLVGPQRVELLLYSTIKAELYNICARYVNQTRK